MTINLNNKSQRFLGAANTLLKAMKSHAGMNSLIPIGVNAATATRCYTLKELVDAMSILIRLGFVPDQQIIGTAQRTGGHCGHVFNPVPPKRQMAFHKWIPGRPFVETHSLKSAIAASRDTMK